MLISSSSHSMPEQEAADALKLLAPAKLITYTAENGTRRIGLVADGLAETLPQAVEIGSGGGCTVWLEQLVPVLVGAVIQLQQEVEDLRKSATAAKSVVKKKGKVNVS
jgi:hypothetical protein